MFQVVVELAGVGEAELAESVACSACDCVAKLLKRFELVELAQVLFGPSHTHESAALTDGACLAQVEHGECFCVYTGEHSGEGQQPRVALSHASSWRSEAYAFRLLWLLGVVYVCKWKVVEVVR